MATDKNLDTLVSIKIAGTWVFNPADMRLSQALTNLLPDNFGR